MTRHPRTAIVLSGGGSRGAYEVGIIRYLRQVLGPRLGYPVPIDIVTGTSVGAINGSFLAATADTPDQQSDELTNAWTGLHVEDMLGLTARDMVRATRLLLGRDPPPPEPSAYRYGGLLDTDGIERFVITRIPWRRIRRNVVRGHLKALAVSATQVGTGHTITFVDSNEPVPKWSSNPFLEVRAAPIGPRHALASGAIPMLFPAVKIGRAFYVDGGLRLNTPISPAIRLGADRILVVSLRHERQMFKIAEPAGIEHDREVAYPKPLFLAGKALNALLLDHTDYDLERMQRLNAVLEAGQSAFGSEFLDILNRELKARRGAPLRPLQAVHIRPSQDIGAIASDHVQEGRIQVKGRVARRMLERLAQGEARHESDLLSYLLFDGQYARALIDLGFSDAARHEDELAALFTF